MGCPFTGVARAVRRAEARPSGLIDVWRESLKRAPDSEARRSGPVVRPNVDPSHIKGPARLRKLTTGAGKTECRFGDRASGRRGALRAVAIRGDLHERSDQA